MVTCHQLCQVERITLLSEPRGLSSSKHSTGTVIQFPKLRSHGRLRSQLRGRGMTALGISWTMSPGTCLLSLLCLWGLFKQCSHFFSSLKWSKLKILLLWKPDSTFGFEPAVSSASPYHSQRQWFWSALGHVCVPCHTANSLAEEWHFLTPPTLLNERESCSLSWGLPCVAGSTHITMPAAEDFQKRGGYWVSTWACHQKNEPK